MAKRTTRRRRKTAASKPARELYEKLGAFYLGRLYDLEQKEVRPDLFLYDSRDLVTHAVIVGMTGSGKTGLGIGLLEEAALDNIPALIIDPKGDLPNLLLTFPDLRPEDFRPWIDPAEAGRHNQTPDAFAESQAATWREGLQAWGQSGERIARLRQAAEVVVYTPGSRAGVPLSVLHSLAAPAQALRDDGDLYRERLRATVGGLLHLLGIESDPVQGREHVFLANLLDAAWSRGHSLDLAGLIAQVQSPPFDKIGVLDLESAYPAADRAALVKTLNNLLAAPGFEVWLSGEPIDPRRMLWTPEGKPRLAIVSLAHLNDAERMFVVTVLLNEVVAWARQQAGTDSLRALLFMDEIFGFFPPVAEPPSKGPMLTLLKQARAHGLGVVLATQNPADLDYRGLANTGTWFVGRLQTERDKQRLLDGLESATTRGRWPRGWLEKAIAGLEKRVFLVNNVHEDGPAALQTRWTMSYLRGPMTREQLQAALAPRAAASTEPPAAPAAMSVPGGATAGGEPMVPPEVRRVYLPARPGAGPLTYVPLLAGAARLHFTNAKLKVSETRDVVYLTPIRDAAIPVDWAEAVPAGVGSAELAQQAASAGTYLELPGAGARPRNYKGWESDFASWLAASQTLELWRSAGSRALSKPGESEADFRARQALEAREQRDQAVDKLRRKYARKLSTLEDRLRRAEQAVEREQEQAQNQKTQTAISFGATVLGAFVGRKAVSATTLGRATTAARGVSRAVKEQQDVKRARENVEALRGQLAELEAELEGEVAELEDQFDAADDTLEPVSVRVRKSNISVQLVALAWTPHTGSPAGLTPAWG